MRVKWSTIAFVLLCTLLPLGQGNAAPADAPLRQMAATLDPAKIKSVFVLYHELMQLPGKPAQDSLHIIWSQGKRYRNEYWFKRNANGPARNAAAADPVEVETDIADLSPAMRARLNEYERYSIEWCDGKTVYQRNAQNRWEIRRPPEEGMSPFENVLLTWCYGNGSKILEIVQITKGQVRSSREHADVVLSIGLVSTALVGIMRFHGADAERGLPSSVETYKNPGGKLVSRHTWEGWTNQDGIWFPAKCMSEQRIGNSLNDVLDKPREIMNYEYLAAHFNQPIEEKVLGCSIP
ncbi:MAG TPA: hypothetical protein VHR86_06645, partial [Armatimonadota bacterium]|nr:hypothetical protein [Armatimonadota bacterium]